MNPNKPIVFVHIPKTAGTAFETYIHLNLPKEKIAPAFLKANEIVNNLNKNYQFFWGHHYYSSLKDKYQDVYFTTLLRYPVDRVISQFKSWNDTEKLKKNWRDTLTELEIEIYHYLHHVTIDDFLLNDPYHLLPQITDHQTKYLADDPCAASMLESAKNNLAKNFFWFGISERFETSIKLFRNLFQNTLEFKIPERAKNRSKFYLPNISKKAYEILLEINQNDLSLYEYAVDLFDERVKILS